MANKDVYITFRRIRGYLPAAEHRRHLLGTNYTA